MRRATDDADDAAQRGAARRSIAQPSPAQPSSAAPRRARAFATHLLDHFHAVSFDGVGAVRPDPSMRWRLEAVFRIVRLLPHRVLLGVEDRILIPNTVRTDHPRWLGRVCEAWPVLVGIGIGRPLPS